MSKKQKSPARHQVSNPLWTLPVDYVELGDTELYKLYVDLQDKRVDLIKQNYRDDVIASIEVDICHVQNEGILRTDRRRAHEEWVASERARLRAAAQEENLYPDADLDNWEFIKLVRQLGRPRFTSATQQ